jgi:hypothetical protein
LKDERTAGNLWAEWTNRLGDGTKKVFFYIIGGFWHRISIDKISKMELIEFRGQVTVVGHFQGN